MEPDRRRRLLIITYHFPPDGAIGGLRWAGIGKALADLGWQVAVVTAAPKEPGGVESGVRVESCPRFPTLIDGIRGVLRQTGWRNGSASSSMAASASGST